MKLIEGVDAAVAAFVGFAEKGPVNEPTLVTNWTQFTQSFGEFIEASYLAHAVYGYFLNGGGAAYVVRIGADGDGASSVARAELTAAADASKPAFSAKALSAGPDGNDITVEVVDASEPTEDHFKLGVPTGAAIDNPFEPRDDQAWPTTTSSAR